MLFVVMKVIDISGWVQISEGSEIVFVVFKTSDGKMIHGGKVIAKHGCWSLLKGGLLPNFTSVVEIFLKVRCFKSLWSSIFLLVYYIMKIVQSKILWSIIKQNMV